MSKETTNGKRHVLGWHRDFLDLGLVFAFLLFVPLLRCSEVKDAIRVGGNGKA